MIGRAALILAARNAGSGLLVGIARSLTDWAYACYLSDLAVDERYKGRGIGARLIDLTCEAAEEECMRLLIAASGAEAFFRKISMPMADRAFLYPRKG